MKMSKNCAGVFDGLQTRELTKDSAFDEILTGKKNKYGYWYSLKILPQTLLENIKTKFVRIWLKCCCSGG